MLAEGPASMKSSFGVVWWCVRGILILVNGGSSRRPGIRKKEYIERERADWEEGFRMTRRCGSCLRVFV